MIRRFIEFLLIFSVNAQSRYTQVLFINNTANPITPNGSASNPYISFNQAFQDTIFANAQTTNFILVFHASSINYSVNFGLGSGPSDNSTYNLTFSSEQNSLGNCEQLPILAIETSLILNSSVNNLEFSNVKIQLPPETNTRDYSIYQYGQQTAFGLINSCINGIINNVNPQAIFSGASINYTLEIENTKFNYSIFKNPIYPYLILFVMASGSVNIRNIEVNLRTQSESNIEGSLILFQSNTEVMNIENVNIILNSEVNAPNPVSFLTIFNLECIITPVTIQNIVLTGTSSGQLTNVFYIQTNNFKFLGGVCKNAEANTEGVITFIYINNPLWNQGQIIFQIDDISTINSEDICLISLDNNVESASVSNLVFQNLENSQALALSFTGTIQAEYPNVLTPINISNVTVVNSVFDSTFLNTSCFNLSTQSDCNLENPNYFLTLMNLNFQNNTIYAPFGAITLNNLILWITQSYFQNNSWVQSSAVSIVSWPTNFFLTNTTFENEEYNTGQIINFIPLNLLSHSQDLLYGLALVENCRFSNLSGSTLNIIDTLFPLIEINLPFIIMINNVFNDFKFIGYSLIQFGSQSAGFSTLGNYNQIEAFDLYGKFTNVMIILANMVGTNSELRYFQIFSNNSVFNGELMNSANEENSLNFGIIVFLGFAQFNFQVENNNFHDITSQGYILKHNIEYFELNITKNLFSNVFSGYASILILSDGKLLIHQNNFVNQEGGSILTINPSTWSLIQISITNFIVVSSYLRNNFISISKSSNLNTETIIDSLYILNSLIAQKSQESYFVNGIIIQISTLTNLIYPAISVSNSLINLVSIYNQENIEGYMPLVFNDLFDISAEGISQISLQNLEIKNIQINASYPTLMNINGAIVNLSDIDIFIKGISTPQGFCLQFTCDNLTISNAIIEYFQPNNQIEDVFASLLNYEYTMLESGSNIIPKVAFDNIHVQSNIGLSDSLSSALIMLQSTSLKLVLNNSYFNSSLANILYCSAKDNIQLNLENITYVQALASFLSVQANQGQIEMTAINQLLGTSQGSSLVSQINCENLYLLWIKITNVELNGGNFLNISSDVLTLEIQGLTIQGELEKGLVQTQTQEYENIFLSNFSIFNLSSFGCLLCFESHKQGNYEFQNFILTNVIASQLVYINNEDSAGNISNLVAFQVQFCVLQIYQSSPSLTVENPSFYLKNFIIVDSTVIISQLINSCTHLLQQNVIVSNNSGDNLYSFQSAEQQITSSQLKNSIFYGIDLTYNFIFAYQTNLSLHDVVILKSTAPLVANLSELNIESLICGNSINIEYWGGCLSIENSSLEISNSTFFNNFAQIGGSIFLDGSILNYTYSNLTFINNSASIYGNDEATQPFSVILIGIPIDPDSVLTEYNDAILVSMGANQYQIQNCSLSYITNTEFFFSFLDQFIQTITSKSIIWPYLEWNGELLALNQSNNSCILQGSLIPFINRTTELPNTIILTLLRHNIEVEIQFLLRTCLSGEYFDRSTNLCEVCPKNFYSLNPDNPCEVCPNPNIECPGGDILNVSAGFWRIPGQSEILPCVNDTIGRCVGGIDPNNQCLEGYTGYLCQGCNYILGYSLEFGDQCIQCSDNTVVLILKSLAVFLVGLGYELLTIYLTNKSNLDFVQSLLAPEAKENYSQRYFLGIELRMLTNYFQFINIIFNFLKYVYLGFFGLLDDLEMSFVLTTNAASQQSSSLECLMMQLGVDPTMITYRSLQVSLVLPVIQFILCVIVFGILYWRGKIRSFKVYVVLSIVTILFIEQLGIILALFRFSNCYNNYVQYDPSISCNDETYNYYLEYMGYPGLIYWGIFIPLLLLSFLFFSRHKLDERDVRRKYGGLINSYRKSVFYWGFVIMISKLGLSGILTLFQNPMNAAATGIMFLLGLNYIFNMVEPYENKSLQRLEMFSNLAYLSTLFMIIYLNTASTQFEQIFGIGVIIGINVVFLLSICWKLISRMLEIRRRKQRQRAQEDSSLLALNESFLSQDNEGKTL